MSELPYLVLYATCKRKALLTRDVISLRHLNLVQRVCTNKLPQLIAKPSADTKAAMRAKSQDVILRKASDGTATRVRATTSGSFGSIAPFSLVTASTVLPKHSSTLQYTWTPTRQVVDVREKTLFRLSAFTTCQLQCSSSWLFYWRLLPLPIFTHSRFQHDPRLCNLLILWKGSASSNKTFSPASHLKAQARGGAAIATPLHLCALRS